MGSLLGFCCWAHDEQLSWLSCARGTRTWGFQPPQGSASPCHPGLLFGDVSRHCCVLTVPDSALGRLWEPLAHPAAQEASGVCQCLPFLEARTCSFRLVRRGQISCLEGVALCLCNGACRSKKGQRQGWTWVSPGQGKKDTDNPMMWP